MKYSRGPTAVGGWGHCCHHLVPLATCIHGCPCSNAQGAEHHRCICCPLEAALLPGVPISIWTGMLGLAVNCPGPRAVPGATTGRKVALAGAQHQQHGCCYITRHRARHGDNPLCLPLWLLLHQTWARLARRQHGPVPHPRVQNWDRIHHFPAQSRHTRQGCVRLAAAAVHRAMALGRER